MLGQPNYRNDLEDEDEVEAEKESMEEVATSPGGNVDLKCDTTATDPRLGGPTGTKFICSCPSSCAEQHGTVMGTMIYSEDSNICKSAIHAGFLDQEDEGEFVLVVANGEMEYESSMQNEIQSIAYGPSAKAFVFEHLTNIVAVSCADEGNKYKFQGDVGDKWTVRCPKDCTFETQYVYGSEVYALTSSICQSAIHAGMMTDNGGDVSWIIEASQTRYPAKSRNGVDSQMLEGDDGGGAMKFVGNKMTVCSYFKEEYSPTNIFHNWERIDHRQAKRGPSQWTFAAHPTAPGLSFKQNTIIEGPDDFIYGSVLINKNFDCNDGLFKINVYWNTQGMAVIMIRYYDQLNYYSL